MNLFVAWAIGLIKTPCLGDQDPLVFCSLMSHGSRNQKSARHMVTSSCANVNIWIKRRQAIALGTQFGCLLT